jgi:hypothetical protein
MTWSERHSSQYSGSNMQGNVSNVCSVYHRWRALTLSTCPCDHLRCWLSQGWHVSLVLVSADWGYLHSACCWEVSRVRECYAVMTVTQAGNSAVTYLNGVGITKCHIHRTSANVIWANLHRCRLWSYQRHKTMRSDSSMCILYFMISDSLFSNRFTTAELTQAWLTDERSMESMEVELA